MKQMRLKRRGGGRKIKQAKALMTVIETIHGKTIYN